MPSVSTCRPRISWTSDGRTSTCSAIGPPRYFSRDQQVATIYPADLRIWRTMVATQRRESDEVLCGDPAAARTAIVIELTFEYTAGMNAAGVESLLDQVRIGLTTLVDLLPTDELQAVDACDRLDLWQDAQVVLAQLAVVERSLAAAGQLGGQAERDRHLRAEAGQRVPGTTTIATQIVGRRDRASGFEIALQLRFGAGRAYHDLDRLAGDQDPVGGRQVRAAVARSTTVTGWPSSSTGGRARSRTMASAIRLRSATRTAS